MNNNLLATRVRVPPQPHHLVHRSRLINALERGIPEYKLIRIAAPAGYGKTTLLSQWAHSSQYPVAWLSLSKEENDLERFLRYLLAGWESVQPGVRESKLGMLLGAMMPDSEDVLSAFINVANDIAGHLVFVLDDYHLIKNPAIHDALTFLINHQPPSLHFVLAGRGKPPLPLARYRARRELLEFRANDLQFLPAETDDFLKHKMNLDLAQNVLDALHNRLEGWAAGLQLVALTLQQRPVQAEKLVISSRHRFIADYLNEDVLAQLPPVTRHFLLQTSILDDLCGSLCAAVTKKEDAQQILETLERNNLFLVPLDDKREWFRYHRLFADFLHVELRRRHPDQLADLHLSAARWYLNHDMPERAFHHAIVGNHVEPVVEIFDQYCSAKLNGGEIRVVEHWVDSIPPAWYTMYPVLGLARVGIMAFTGAFAECMRLIDEVENALTIMPDDTQDWQRARVTAVRCMLACMQNDLTQAESYAKEALKALPTDDLGWRPGIFVALGDTYRGHSRWEQAERCYSQALSVTNAPQIRFMSAHVFGALADLTLRQGHLHTAEGYWRKALAVINEQKSWGCLPLPLIGWVYIRMGELLYEQNKLAQAWRHLSRGLDHAELGGDVRTLIAGYLIAGRLKLTEGDTEAAADYLEQTRPLMENAQFSHWLSRFERFQLELWLAQDRLRAAVHWSDDMLRDEAIEERPDSAITQLAMARVLVIKGDTQSIERALTLLKHLLKTAEEEGRIGIVIEALALQALAYWRHDKEVNALVALEQALRLAEPEGYVRLFADFGLPMLRLLQEAGSRGLLPDYVTTLQQALGTGDEVSLETSLLEPLTQREQEVLELVSVGLTNPEIGEKLVISPETVKKHTSSIYGKLSVSNRTEAVARARALDLL